MNNLPELAVAAATGASPQDLLDCAVPSHYQAIHLRAQDVDIFRGAGDKDVTRSIKLGPVPMPEVDADEVLVAVMASAINYNTVWSATFEPVPTFTFLERLPNHGSWAKHRRDTHVLGSDAAGVVVRCGALVRHWNVGDHVVVHPGVIDGQEPISQHDGVLTRDPRAWGYETNFGGLAQFCLVKASQLLKKARHLSWEEAAVNTACAATAYRMLVGENGARIKQGDIVLVWGATGGIGSYAVQFVRNGGGIAVGVVRSSRDVELARRLGCEVVIDLERLSPEGVDPQALAKPIGKEIRLHLGEDPHVVVDYLGRATFAASVLLAGRGGTIVTCGSSTGYQHAYDNRHLWTRSKRIIGSYGANYHEAWQANRLIGLGHIVPTLSKVCALDDVAAAARTLQLDQHVGKIGVRCCARAADQGIGDAGLRERISENRLQLFRSWVS